jgi:hypothetical protein
MTAMAVVMAGTAGRPDSATLDHRKTRDDAPWLLAAGAAVGLTGAAL